jgi:hypothetical protein
VPSDPIFLFMLHAVFEPIIQAELDRFVTFWNEHEIKGARTVEGHGGGIPTELFHDATLRRERVVKEDTDPFGYTPGILFDRDEKGRLAIDASSTFGAETTATMGDHDFSRSSLTTRDPLECSPLLQDVRAAYIQAKRLRISTDDIGPTSSTYDKFRPHIAEYIRFKAVCYELLECALHFWAEDGFKWAAFAESDALDAYAASVHMRRDLAAFGMSLSA